MNALHRTHCLSAILLIGLTTAAQDPAFDAFERSGGPGPDWTIYFGGNNVTIVQDSDLGLINGQQFGIAAWVGSTFSADQFCEGVISPEKIDSMWAQVFVRRRTSDFARYAFHWSDRDTVTGYGWYDLKYDGVPTPQTRILGSTLAPMPAAGDTLRLEVITNPSGYPELRGYHNGDLVVTGIDSAAVRIMDGEPGLVFRFRLGWPATWPSKVFEEWGGGSLAGFSKGVEEGVSAGGVLLIAPNPAQDAVTLQFNANEAGLGTMILTDVMGKLVLQRLVRYVSGRSEVQLDVAAFKPGIYQVDLRTASSDVARTKLLLNR